MSGASVSGERKPEMIQVTIDGRKTQVAPGTTILAAAQQAGIAIPALCHSPLVEAYGVCRVCTRKPWMFAVRETQYCRCKRSCCTSPRMAKRAAADSASLSRTMD